MPDPDIHLYDSTGNHIKGYTNYSTSSSSLVYSISTSGSYYVGVTDSSDVGNYILTWLGNDSVLRNTATTATLAIGGTFTSAIDVAGDSDWIKVELKAGLDYGFQVTGDGSSSSLPDGDLRLRDASGNVVAGDTNYSSSSFSIYESPQQTGSYYVEVADASDTGNYKVNWLGNDAILRNASTDVSLDRGQSVSSKIDVQGDSDWFAVTLKEGFSYAFNVQGTGTAKLPDGDIHLRDADGNVVVSGNNYSNSSYTIAYTAASSGTFYVEVTDASDIGGYKVTNIGKDTIVNNADTSSTIVDGGHLTGTIDANRDSDWHALKVKAGTTYEIDLHGGAGAKGADDVHLILRDANGDSIDESYGDSPTITWKATKTGTVYLDTAGSSFETTGTYTLDVVSNSALLKGTSKNDDLTGGANKTRIVGYDGNDKLNGGGGNDSIVGGHGIDRLYGGTGSDTFVFAAGDSGKTKTTSDTIFDFTRTDTIDLSGMDANTKTGHNDDFDFIGTKSFTRHAGELRFEKSSSDTWVYGDTNGDGKADFVIHLDDAVAIKASHFDL